MPKFLKSRCSDIPGRAGEPAACAMGGCADGEWVTAGSYAVCELGKSYRCDPPCHCDCTFLALTSTARCANAEIVEIEAAEIDALKTQMMANLPGTKPGTADTKSARALVEREIAYTVALAESFPTATVIRVMRRAGPDGSLEEQYNACGAQPEA
ncbi:MAG: DUF6505 family protein [Betaproteobacteria bacterium]